MTNYKLTYFNFRGKGEVARLIFTYAKVEFEDVRLEFSQWPEIKSTTPYGQLPVLEVDGKPLAQTLAIARYLGKQFGLVPDSDWDQAIADALGNLSEDMFWPARDVLPTREPDEEKRNAKKPEILAKSIYPILDKIEAILANNASGWLVGDKITWVDFLYFSFAEFFVAIFGKDVFRKYDNLTKQFKRIKDIPQIAEYLEKRPVTAI